jgi:hypothetical protein
MFLCGLGISGLWWRSYTVVDNLYAPTSRWYAVIRSAEACISVGFYLNERDGMMLVSVRDSEQPRMKRRLSHAGVFRVAGVVL